MQGTLLFTAKVCMLYLIKVNPFPSTYCSPSLDYCKFGVSISLSLSLSPPPLCSNHHPSAHKACCLMSCHPYCHNHYSVLRTTPHQRLPKKNASSQILATAGIDTVTSIVEITASIRPHQSTSTFSITPSHHSTALISHPLLKLMYSTNTPNCHHLKTIL